jgi:hypothetical protein
MNMHSFRFGKRWLLRNLLTLLKHFDAMPGNYTAATDDSDKLRYPAGKDAEVLLEYRRTADDESFFSVIKEQFGLAS